MQNIVIGTGLAGLVLTEILKTKGKEVIALGDTMGGQMNSSFPLGPRILQHSKSVEEFLKHIGIEAEPRLFKVGYLTDEKFTDTVTEEQRQLYYLKTRGNSNINKTTMSEGKTSILGWDLNDINLVDVLYARNKDVLQHYFVHAIDPINNIINNDLKYTNLFSTIPMPVLLKILGSKVDFNSFLLKEVHFTHIKAYLNMFEMFDFDYVYDVRKDSAINRITRVKENEYVIESIKELDFARILGHKAIKSQIVHEQKLNEYLGINLVGRYAQFDHSIKTNNIIDRFW